MPLSTPARTGGTVAADLAGSLTRRSTDRAGRVVEAALLAALVASLVILVTLLVHLVQRAWPVLSNDLGGFLSRGQDVSSAKDAGIWHAIRGTLVLSVIVAIVAFPLGVACAIYLEEYAGASRLARATRLNVRNLAGVPSIVYGILGLALFVKFLEPVTNGRTVIAGGLALSVLVLPIVIITASEALRAVPRSIREGALGVGATQWETVRHHVLPAAAPGILTGTVLSLARAAGEAAPLLLVGAATGLLRYGDQSLWTQITEGRFTALPVAIFNYARQPGADFRQVTAAASLVLVVLVFLVNGLAIWLRNRYRREW
jgi:phosphate transport system permease protein